LQPYPAASLDQLQALKSGCLGAGFVDFMPKADPELGQLAVADQHVELTVPKTKGRCPGGSVPPALLQRILDSWFQAS
jgi:hypothetical protein